MFFYVFMYFKLFTVKILNFLSNCFDLVTNPNLFLQLIAFSVGSSILNLKLSLMFFNNNA